MSQYNSYNIICYAACQLTLGLPDPLVDSQLGIHTNARQNFKDNILLVQFVRLFGCYSLMSHCDTIIIMVLILHLNMHFKHLC